MCAISAVPAVLSKSLPIVMRNLMDRVAALEARLDSWKTNNSKTSRQVAALDVPLPTLSPLFDARRPDFIDAQIGSQQQQGRNCFFLFR